MKSKIVKIIGIFLLLTTVGAQSQMSFAQEPIDRAPAADSIWKKYRGNAKAFQALTENVTLNFAASSEKKTWLTAVLADFAKTEAGQKITVNVTYPGSIDGGRQTLDKNKSIQIWSPANSLYRNYMIKQGAKLSTDTNSLVTSPLVILMPQQRYDAFLAKYKEVTLENIVKAMSSKEENWAENWGPFKFAHSNGTSSNSGFLTLLAYVQHEVGSVRPLSRAQVSDQIVEKLKTFESLADNSAPDTAMLIKKFLLLSGKLDAIAAYENSAGEYIRKAKGRAIILKVAYPNINIWSDHPFYIVDRPWVSEQQKIAAVALYNYLMDTDAQQKALVIGGFRPGNIDVEMDGATSPFTLYAASGLQPSTDKLSFCEAPEPEALELLQSKLQELPIHEFK